MKRLILVALLLWISAPARGQFGARPRSADEVVTRAEAKLTPTTAKRGETITWSFTVELIPDWHTYPTRQPDPKADSYTSKVKPPKPGDVIFVGLPQDPPNPKTKAEPVLEIKELRYYENSATWELKAVVSPNASPGPKKVAVPFTFQVCDEQGCLAPQTNAKELALTVSDEPAVPIDPKYADDVKKALNPSAPPPPPKPAENVEAANPDYKKTLAGLLAQMTKQQVAPNTGLGAFLLTAVFWGAVSLVTPCVFPMIPITVSFFLKQSEKNHTSPMLLALVYSGTIIVVLGTGALTLLGFFRALSVNPWMNFFLGTLFVVLALSLFGMFDLTLPHSLTRFTSSREGQGGVVGTIFMALTFTIVSFTCVAPFLGGFGGMASSGQFRTWELILGAIAFSGTFAAPFFVLALFPSLLRKLPKSGGWLHSVKVVMGFLELAAALKFFRAGELIYKSKAELFTFDLVLGLWVALAILCGLYLVNLIRIAGEEPAESVSVPRFLFGFLFIGLGLYLMPAQFAVNGEGDKQRPRGTVYAWVDSFLLPEPRETAGGDLAWTGDLKRAVDEARAMSASTGKPQYVFVDFTGETCTNCKLNEREVFTKKEIRDLLTPFRRVQLYTDKVPDEYYSTVDRSKFADTSRQRADALANLWFQGQAFGTEQLPLYVILRPTVDGRIERVGVYDEGKINNVGAFAEFLKKPFQGEMVAQATGGQ
jgi:thiol:disulfide interchange protein DsbD